MARLSNLPTVLITVLFLSFSYNSLANSSKPLNNTDTTKNIALEKDLSYTKYSLQDKYSYNKKDREFQWDKIKKHLAYVSSIQNNQNKYAVVTNYQNRNGIAPLVSKYHKNKYKNIADSLGTERYQSAPLYKKGTKKTPTIYGRDGSLVKITSSDTLPMISIQGLSNIEGEWDIPKKYIKSIGTNLVFKHVIVVDAKNQNICLLEQITPNKWKIRSMNPSTTGKNKPPYSRITPTGIFVVQEKKPKMYYAKDGTTTLEGFAPWASRFTNGAYIHGVPVKNPNGKIKEYSPSLGTIPLSHMCVRNASSHAKHIYDQIIVYQTLVIVID